MRYFAFATALVAAFSLVGCAPTQPQNEQNATMVLTSAYDRCSGDMQIKPYMIEHVETIRGLPNQITPCQSIRISVVGQGVSPTSTISPAQAFAMAKRAAVADAYRMIAERIAGVHVEGHDFIKNMVVQRSEVRTKVDALIRNATIAETSYKEGLCEVEMEIILSYASVVL